MLLAGRSFSASNIFPNFVRSERNYKMLQIIYSFLFTFSRATYLPQGCKCQSSCDAQGNCFLTPETRGNCLQLCCIGQICDVTELPFFTFFNTDFRLLRVFQNKLESRDVDESCSCIFIKIKTSHFLRSFKNCEEKTSEPIQMKQIIIQWNISSRSHTA